MNKGFFVVFLGIIIGAMALIFFNQAHSPVVAATVAQAPAPKEEAAAQAPVEPVAKPVEKPETAAPAPTAPEAAAPAKPEPEPAKPAAPQPEPEKSAPPAPAEPAQPKPEPAAPAVAPEAAKPEPAATEPAKADSPGPESVKPETPKPDSVASPEPAKTEQAATPPAKPKGKNPVLQNISLHFKDNGMALRIEADRQFSYKTFVLPTPDRYVVDLIGTWENLRVPKVPANQLVKSMRIGKQSGGPRMVMDLQRAPKKHNVVWLSPTILEIQIE